MGFAKLFFEWGRGGEMNHSIRLKKYNSIPLWTYLHMLQVSLSNIKTL